MTKFSNKKTGEKAVSPPYLPDQIRYTLDTKDHSITSGDMVTILTDNYVTHRVFRGYVGLIIEILDNEYRVIFGSDDLHYNEKSYSKTGVFLIKKDHVMRAYLHPLVKFDEQEVEGES